MHAPPSTPKELPETLEEVRDYFLFECERLFLLYQRLDQQHQLLGNMIQRLNLLHHDELNLTLLDQETLDLTKEALQQPFTS